MACFYAMNELAIPFEEIGIYGVVLKVTGRDPRWGSPIFERTPFPSEVEEKAATRSLFTLRVCKGCRSEWMEAVKNWFRAPPGDISRWNNDESTYGLKDDLPALLARVEAMRTDFQVLEARIVALREDLRREHQRRETGDTR
jgi:hypothetical protein